MLCYVRERTSKYSSIVSSLYHIFYSITPSPESLTTDNMAVSQCRQNYHAECEAGVNRQINMELYASYCYQSMVSFIQLSCHTT